MNEAELDQRITTNIGIMEFAITSVSSNARKQADPFFTNLLQSIEKSNFNHYKLFLTLNKKLDSFIFDENGRLNPIQSGEPFFEETEEAEEESSSSSFLIEEPEEPEEELQAQTFYMIKTLALSQKSKEVQYQLEELKNRVQFKNDLIHEEKMELDLQQSENQTVLAELEEHEINERKLEQELSEMREELMQLAQEKNIYKRELELIKTKSTVFNPASSSPAVASFQEREVQPIMATIASTTEKSNNKQHIEASIINELFEQGKTESHSRGLPPPPPSGSLPPPPPSGGLPPPPPSGGLPPPPPSGGLPPPPPSGSLPPPPPSGGLPPPPPSGGLPPPPPSGGLPPPPPSGSIEQQEIAALPPEVSAEAEIIVNIAPSDINLKAFYWDKMKAYDVKPESIWKVIPNSDVVLSEDQINILVKNFEIVKESAEEEVTPRLQKPKLISIIEGKLAEKIEIILEKFKLRPETVKEKILKMDLSFELAHLLVSAIPPEDAVDQVLRSLVEEPDLEKYGIGERFIAELGMIPRLQNRLRYYCASGDFETDVTLCESFCSNFTNFFGTLANVEAMEGIMLMLRSLGNFINSNTPSRGNAFGFRMKSLEKFHEMRLRGDSLLALGCKWCDAPCLEDLYEYKELISKTDYLECKNLFENEVLEQFILIAESCSTIPSPLKEDRYALFAHNFELKYKSRIDKLTESWSRLDQLIERVMALYEDEGSIKDFCATWFGFLDQFHENGTQK